jgi:hypothetical protein
VRDVTAIDQHERSVFARDSAERPVWFGTDQISQRPTVSDAELAQQRRHMTLHRADRNAELAGNLGIGPVPRHSHEHLPLTVTDPGLPTTAHTNIIRHGPKRDPARPSRVRVGQFLCHSAVM